MSSSAAEASATIEVVHEMSRLLDTGLNRETLTVLISLCESGINPEALAGVVKELRREARSHRSSRTAAPSSAPSPVLSRE